MYTKAQVKQVPDLRGRAAQPAFAEGPDHPGGELRATSTLGGWVSVW